MFPVVAACSRAVCTVWTAAGTVPASWNVCWEGPEPMCQCPDGRTESWVGVVSAWLALGQAGSGAHLVSTATPFLWFFISPFQLLVFPQTLLSLHNPHIFILKGLSFTDSLVVSSPAPLSINCCVFWTCRSWQFSVGPQLVRRDIVTCF